MNDWPQGSVARPHTHHRLRRRIHGASIRVWHIVNRRVRSSISLVLKVEGSLALFACYGGLGYGAAYALQGVLNA